MKRPPRREPPAELEVGRGTVHRGREVRGTFLKILPQQGRLVGGRRRESVTNADDGRVDEVPARVRLDDEAEAGARGNGSSGTGIADDRTRHRDTAAGVHAERQHGFPLLEIAANPGVRPRADAELEFGPVARLGRNPEAQREVPLERLSRQGDTERHGGAH